MNDFLRHQYLQAIGVQSWLLRASPDIVEQELIADAEEQQPAITYDADQDFKPQVSVAAQIKQQGAEKLQAEPQIEASDELQEAPKPAAEKVPPVTIPVVTEKDALPVSKLEQSIAQCKKCAGRHNRLNALAGQGNPSASVFVISEAPNAEEDRSGYYLSAQGQSLFTAMLHSIQLHKDYFFTGIIKCFSLSDYLFSEQDINSCAPFLKSQIEQVNPSVILVLGVVPAQAMVQSKKSFNELRGQAYSVNINNKDYPLVISYHPAYLLRNPLYKRKALKDLILLKNLLQ